MFGTELVVYVNAFKWEEWSEEDSCTRKHNQVAHQCPFHTFSWNEGCSGVLRKVTQNNGSELNQTTPNSINDIYNKCKKQRANREWLQAILSAFAVRLKGQRKSKMCNIIQSVLWQIIKVKYTEEIEKICVSKRVKYWHKNNHTM